MICIRKRKLFKRYLILVLLVATIPMVAISFALYFGVSSQMEQTLDENSRAYVQNSARTADAQLLSLERAALFWSGNDKLIEHLTALQDAKAIVRVDQYERMNAVLNLIIPMQNAYDLIDRIDIFLPKTHLNLSHYGSCAEVVQPAELAFYLKAASQLATSAWHLSPDGKRAVLVQEVLAQGDCLGIMCITLDDAKLREMALTLRMDAQNTVLILTDDLHPLAAVGPSGDEFVPQLVSVMVEDGGQDAFRTVSNGEAYRVLVGQFECTGWRYLLALPLDQLTAPVKDAAKLFLSISITCVLLAGLLAWQTSSRLYRPIGQLATAMGGSGAQDDLRQIEDNWRQLLCAKDMAERRLREGLSQFRENMLYRLLMGAGEERSEAELREDLKTLLGRPCKPYCRVAYIRLFGAALSKQGAQHERVISFAARDLLGQRLKGSDGIEYTPVLTGNLALCLGITHTDDGNQQVALIVDTIRDVADALACALNIHVVAALSHPSTQLSELPQLREEALQLYQCRRLSPQNQIINAHEHQIETESMRYPFDIEGELVQHLLLGDLGACQTSLKKLFEAFGRADAVITYDYCIFQLLGNLQRVMLLHGFKPEHLILPDGLPAVAIQNCAEDKYQWVFDNVIRRYRELINEHQNIRLKRIVMDTINAIGETYMNDVSLDYFADMQDVSSATLSRAFKRYTGKTFIDYLTDLRISEAKRMLIETTLKVGDIAEAVGYRATYFNRIFRAHEGVTPGEYRANSEHDGL